MYAYNIHYLCHSDHTFGFNILPFIATLRQRISVESAIDERALRALCSCNIRHTAIYDISKITYSLYHVTTGKNFRVAVIEIARLYIAISCRTKVSIICIFAKSCKKSASWEHYIHRSISQTKIEFNGLSFFFPKKIKNLFYNEYFCSILSSAKYQYINSFLEKD